ncbi:copper ion binding protein [Rhynchospora pubera]|uniref:Copper ion binding protein n=1 Tax=Rhynchospora pubera TaxID=906938 RepID=A0AAV8GFW9_9POAL|nr:copper ion binding protein [Rhynchospora pubera]KAJ4802306.1 copper ion binding protein [Rhynchospora pubera]
MAGRVGIRHVSRRFFSSGGKVLSEEEKAAENVYIKKMEQEKLEKAARQGPKAAESSTASSGDAKAGASVHESSTEGASTDKNRNYAVVAGTVAFAGVLGWYLLSKPKKSKEEISD